MSQTFDHHAAAVADIEELRQALRRATSLEQVKAVWDAVEEARKAANNAGMDQSVQNLLVELRIRTERRGGKLLAAMSLPRGRRGRVKSPEQSASLACLGISKNQSSGWQRLAAIPQAVLDSRLQAIKEASEPLSINMIVALADSFRITKGARRRQRPTKSPRTPAPAIVSTAHDSGRDMQELKDTLDQLARVLQCDSVRPAAELPPTSVRYARQLTREMRAVVLRLVQRTR